MDYLKIIYEAVGFALFIGSMAGVLFFLNIIING